MIKAARRAHVRVRAGVQCAFGCAFEGPVAVETVYRMVAESLDTGVDLISLADTTGMATPATVDGMLERLLPVLGDTPLVLHFHDTRGLGLVNLKTALEHGVDRFDTSLGGMGGCPFIPGAAGNIATEDTLHLLAAAGIESGIDMTAVAACTRRLEEHFRTRFPGRMHRVLVSGEV